MTESGEDLVGLRSDKYDQFQVHKGEQSAQAEELETNAFITATATAASTNIFEKDAITRYTPNEFTTTSFVQYNPNNSIPLTADFQYSQAPERKLKETASSKVTKPTVKKFSALPKSSRPYACSFENCTWAFIRQSDLSRHMKSHQPPTFLCPYWRNDPTCHRNGGAFARLDVLKRHLKLVHFVKDKQVVSENSKDDPGWCRSCQRMFPNSKSFIDHCIDCASQFMPTEWKKKDESP